MADIVLVYDSVGTFNWLCPYGISTVKVEAWGAGGGGGVVAGNGGGGGGGGAFAQTDAYGVIPGTAYTIVVGAGGGTDVTTQAGSSTFDTNGVLAVGGFSVNGTAGGAFGSASACVGGTAFNGGAGGGGNTTGDIGGGGGGGAGPNGTGVTGTVAAGGVGAKGGNGNNSLGGGGGAGGNGTNGTAGTSNILGGGGR